MWATRRRSMCKTARICGKQLLVRWVLTNMDEPRDRNFWSVVDKVFTEMDSSW
ncbi:hypothetical protein Egran_02462, partial [Elaphomyces granulatus]